MSTAIFLHNWTYRGKTRDGEATCIRARMWFLPPGMHVAGEPLHVMALGYKALVYWEWGRSCHPVLPLSTRHALRHGV